jgi:ribose/xylose/arabinose/galactoside ABC-type transport system permease subunit
MKQSAREKLLLPFARSRALFLVLMLVIEILIMTILNPSFIKPSNLVGILQFGATTAFLTLGEALVIIVIPGGIDISVGGIVSLSCVIFGKMYQYTQNLLVAGLVTVAAGVLMGALNGVMCGYLSMPSLIATLATQYIFASIAMYITGGSAISNFPDALKWLGNKSTLGIPNQILFAVLPACLVMLFLIYKTKFGRRVYLTGTNAVAARFAAINAENTIFWTFTITGTLSAIGAIVNTAWLMTARADAGSGMEMNAITAAMLGGISVLGGRGKLSGVLIAIVIITMLDSGLQMASINSVWRLAISGAILVLSVVFNDLANKLITSSEKAKNMQKGA